MRRRVVLDWQNNQCGPVRISADGSGKRGGGGVCLVGFEFVKWSNSIPE